MTKEVLFPKHILEKLKFYMLKHIYTHFSNKSHHWAATEEQHHANQHMKINVTGFSLDV